MGKGHRHMKNLKSEKAKVKLKAKKMKHLPKGLNVTEPTLKVKKIVIREQLKRHNETEILSKRKLNVKDLLSRLQHHNSTVRQEAIRELKDILLEHSSEVLSSQFGPLLQGVSALSLDREKDIRRDCLKVLSLILSSVTNEQLMPFSDVLISYLKCSMTHIDPRIKEDALLFLDVLVQHCSSILAQNSHKVLPNFLDMISRLQIDMKPGRQLMTTLNSKNTSVKWRIKVLERLASMFRSIVMFYKSEKDVNSNGISQVTYVGKNTKYVPVYKNLNSQICEVDFEENDNIKENAFEKALNAEEFIKYIELLMPLIFDSWIEVCPDEKHVDNSEFLISNEASELLKSIVEIVQLITECIDMWYCDSEVNMKLWFKNNFENPYKKNFFSRFPYNNINATRNFGSSMHGRNRKRQEDFSGVESHDECLEHNLGLCQIYVWFTSVHNDTNNLPKLNNPHCTSVVTYLNDKLDSWSDTSNSILLLLTKLLRTLFLKASKIWYGNHIDLNEVLQSVVNIACSSKARKEVQLQLFTIISDIMLDHTLHELHREYAFKEFVSSLPSLLLKPKIHDNTIQMINRIVLRYREWIQEKLMSSENAIIANAKKIEIIGTEDEKRARLMICNLFYFMDTQIYY